MWYKNTISHLVGTGFPLFFFLRNNNIKNCLKKDMKTWNGSGTRSRSSTGIKNRKEEPWRRTEERSAEPEHSVRFGLTPAWTAGDLMDVSPDPETWVSVCTEARTGFSRNAWLRGGVAPARWLDNKYVPRSIIASVFLFWSVTWLTPTWSVQSNQRPRTTFSSPAAPDPVHPAATDRMAAGPLWRGSSCSWFSDLASFVQFLSCAFCPSASFSPALRQLIFVMILIKPFLKKCTNFLIQTSMASSVNTV